MGNCAIILKNQFHSQMNAATENSKIKTIEMNCSSISLTMLKDLTNSLALNFLPRLFSVCKNDRRSSHLKSSLATFPL